MSDLTDNSFYPSAERIWLCIRLNNSSLIGPAIALQKMTILAKKKHLFRWNSFWSWRVCIQEKLSHLGHRKSAGIHWFWSRGIIGPFFFENKQEEAVTVNGDRYWAMLNKVLFTKIQEKDIGNIWFQQDGATFHTANATRFDTVGLLFVGCRQR